MSHFARHASDEMGAANRWIVALADFLGLVTSESTEPAGFDAAISRIASRRASEPDPATCQIDPSTCAQELPDSVGQRRGVTRVTWLDAIETLGFSSFEQLRERFARAAFHRAAGPFAGTGFAVNSASSELSIDGLSTRDAKDAVIAWLERTGIGRRRVNFKLRDWLFSRQRYWGEPFPVVFDEHGDHHAVGDAALPVVLPDLKEFRPPESDDPAPMLAAATDWLATTAGAAGVPDLAPEAPVRREANTMPNWAGSCWYYLRFCDPKNAAQFASPEALAYWMGSTGIDLYIGGSEHAVLHLLYARFWHKVLFDLGLVPCPEPAAKLFHQGMITSFAYQRPDKSLVPADHVHLMVCENPEDMPEPDWSNWPQPQKLLKPLRMRVDSVGQWVGWKVKSHDILLINAGNLKRLREHGGSFYFETGAPGTPLEQIVERELEPREQTVAKMSKTLKNVINPDDVIAEFGADTMRLYEMAMGPLEASKPWNPRDIVGCYRFLQKAWRLIVDEQSGAPRPHAPTADSAVEKALHRLIAKVGPDIERLSFNTAIAAMMEFIKVPGPDGLTLDQAERFVLVLAPFAPHLAEELWSKLGHAKSLAHEPWPAHDPAMLRESTIEIAVQIMGKVRGHITVAADADQATVEKAALAEPRVRELIEGKTIRKVIVVPGKLVNIVAG
ncbi:MAG: class I tRNA ligase family protein [Phycisphaerales bacterium]